MERQHEYRDGTEDEHDDNVRIAGLAAVNKIRYRTRNGDYRISTAQFYQCFFQILSHSDILLIR